jgi:hypothetical protein
MGKWQGLNPNTTPFVPCDTLIWSSCPGEVLFFDIHMLIQRSWLGASPEDEAFVLSEPRRQTRRCKHVKEPMSWLTRLRFSGENPAALAPSAFPGPTRS